MNNRGKEMEQKEIYNEGWKISKKYSTILMYHEKDNENFLGLSCTFNKGMEKTMIMMF